MKKAYRFDELSDTPCVVTGCTKMIKRRLEEANRKSGANKPLKCYRHHAEFEAGRGHFLHKEFIPKKTVEV